MKIFFIIIFALATLQISAQRPSAEFQIYGGAGIPISFQSGISTSGLNADVGIGFTAFVSQNIGIHLGVGIGTMRREITIDNLQTVAHGLIDANSYLFDLHSTFSGYRETLRTNMYFNIPLMLQFQPNTQGFYAMGGIKMLLPIGNVNYDVSVATLRNAGYYPELGNWATEQIFAGFGTFEGNSTSGSFDLGFSTVLTLETGWKWRIGTSSFLYTGVFFNYWLNDPAGDNRRPLGDFTMPLDFTNLALLNYADNMNPIFVGIRLRLAFTRSDTPRPARGRHGILQGHCPPPARSSRNESPIFNRPS